MSHKADKVFTYFLPIICVAATFSNICTDTDSTLCDLMLNRIPDFCGDPCLAKYCKRSCKKCPLQCYDCAEISNVANCTTITTCNDVTDYCFTAQTFTAHFTEVYKMGCGSRQTCLQYTNGQHSLEAGCCNSDRCNNKPPVLLKIQPKQVVTSPTTDPSICINRDDDVCTQLTLLLGNPCSDDCVATKLCPHMCRKCFSCLDCYEVDHPDNCTETTTCGFGKECYGLEKLGSNFNQVIQLGCVAQTLCEQLSSQSVHIFGKRDFTFKGGCCIGDRCNGQPVSTSGQSTNHITKPSQCLNHLTDCPVGFHRFKLGQYVGNLPTECYHLGDQKMTKREAEAYCTQRCANLFFTDPTSVNLFEVNALVLFTNTTAEAYTGIERNNHGHWVWSHNNATVSRAIVRYIYPPEENDCVIAVYDYDSYTTKSVESFKTVACTALYKPLCKINL